MDRRCRFDIRLNDQSPHFFRIEARDAHPIHRDRGRADVCFCFLSPELRMAEAAWNIERGMIIAQRFKIPLIGPVFNALHSICGHEVTPQERTIVKMPKLPKAGGKCGVLTDLSLDPRAPRALAQGVSTMAIPTEQSNSCARPGILQHVHAVRSHALLTSNRGC